MHRPNYGLARSEAKRLLRNFGYSDPPVNPAEIARHLGIKVFFVEFSGKFSKVSGFYDYEEDAIYVNKQDFALHKIFTIAHELGHRMLHRDWAASQEYRVLARDEDATRDEYELEADEFAGQLLAPRFMLDKYIERVTLPELSRLFVISIPELKVRLSKEYGI